MNPGSRWCPRLLYSLHANSTVWFSDGQPPNKRLLDEDNRHPWKRSLRLVLFIVAVVGCVAWLVCDVRLNADGFNLGVRDTTRIRFMDWKSAQEDRSSGVESFSTCSDPSPAAAHPPGIGSSGYVTLCFCALNRIKTSDVQLRIIMAPPPLSKAYLSVEENNAITASNGSRVVKSVVRHFQYCCTYWSLFGFRSQAYCSAEISGKKPLWLRSAVSACQAAARSPCTVAPPTFVLDLLACIVG